MKVILLSFGVDELSYIVHTLPVLINNDQDLIMLHDCLRSLTEHSISDVIIIYNQGGYTNQELSNVVSLYSPNYKILGNAVNEGIPIARQSCFHYIWSKIPDCEYITEIHQDMIFSVDWSIILKEFLEKNLNEPCISPGILTAFGELHPHQKGHISVSIPEAKYEVLPLLEHFQQDQVAEGFVHPVMHRSSLLKEIGGYDLNYLTGFQGYEDDYLLLSYYYKINDVTWKPKAYLRAIVFHYTLAQRVNMNKIEVEFQKNRNGILKRFGTKGLEDLAIIHEIKKGEDIIIQQASKMNLVIFDSFNTYSSLPSLPCCYSQFRVFLKEENNFQTDEVINIPLTELSKIDAAKSIAIAFDPLWISVIKEWEPIAVITVIDESTEENFMINSYINYSDIIWVRNLENTYVKYLLRHPLVFNSLNENPTNIFENSGSHNDKLYVEIIQCIERAPYNYKDDLSNLLSSKRNTHIQHLNNLLEIKPNDEGIYFTLARLLYVQGNFIESEKMLFEAFSRNVIFNKPDSLNTYYPWIMLVQARQGKTLDALNSLGIQAFSTDQKRVYFDLLKAYESNYMDVINQEIALHQGDFLWIDQLQSNSEIQMSATMYFYYAKERGLTDLALQLLNTELESASIMKEKLILLAEREAVNGEISKSNHYFLQASCLDEGLLLNILKLKKIWELLSTYRSQS